jgi:glutathione reductase (NADPH)
MQSDQGFDVDLFVIGGGSGGVRAARIAAGHGARVAIAEEHRWGGTCVIRGCVPKKLFVYASEMRAAFADARGFGWRVEGVDFDWGALVAAKDKEIARLSGLYRLGLERVGVKMLEGRARVVGPQLVEIGGRRIRARVILIATGGRAVRPAVPGGSLCFTSDEAFHLPVLPKRIAVLGAGYIAIEFAHIFRGLGCEVTLVHRGDRVLRGFDEDVRSAVTDGLRHHGIRLELDATFERIEERPEGGLAVVLSDRAPVVCDAVMAAIGRTPSTAGLGLEEVGVALRGDGGVIVDAMAQSNVTSIYAVGDCTNQLMLTPTAIREGHAFADSRFGGKPTPVHHENIPTAVFGQPPAAAVGLTEIQARARFGTVEIYRTTFRPLFHTLGGRDEKTMMKLIVDGATRRVVGAHMVGGDAPEIIQTLAVAVTLGATKEQLDATAALHPTAAEELMLMRTPVPPPAIE